MKYILSVIVLTLLVAAGIGKDAHAQFVGSIDKNSPNSVALACDGLITGMAIISNDEKDDELEAKIVLDDRMENPLLRMYQEHRESVALNLSPFSLLDPTEANGIITRAVLKAIAINPRAAEQIALYEEMCRRDILFIPLDK